MTAWDASVADFERRLARQGSRRAPLSARTQTAYLKDVRALATWIAAHGIDGPERITPSVLAAALRALGWSAATQARALTAAREWLAPHFPPGRSPAERLERPKVRPPLIPRLSQADAVLLVDVPDIKPAPAHGLRGALDLRDRAVLEVLYGSALRRQEVCDLELSGLDFEHETVRVVGKGGKARTVPLTEPAIEALGAWLRQGRPLVVDRSAPVRNNVFLSVRGRPLDGSAVYRIVAPRLRAMGRSGGPHLLRHAAATHLLEGHDDHDGAHLRVVQEVLGHASLATTQRYTGVTTKDIQRQLRRGHPRG
jgi:site-specific recombinase XerD